MVINPFTMYVLEQEGYLTTRESKIKKAIKDIKHYAAIASNEIFNQALLENGIDPDSLTKLELREIKNAI